MPELKIYDDSPAPYNVPKAEANLTSKKSKDRIDIFNNFLSERFTFNKMLDFLVGLTPTRLKSEETISDAGTLAGVLKEQERQYTQGASQVPRFHFQELPPIPQPLTADSFRDYIYFLTHLRILYKNSSSLESGIVPDILLYTHHLDNTEFKPFRSVDTFNYLIKYFGYDKFQSSFARELLLVMSKDGHKPNIGTINELLKICRKHSDRRSLVSTYSVVINYLVLVKRMNLEINLTTWNRIYDCIDNIFLKELFVNKMSAINLPILHNMCNSILRDFATTTSDTQEVVDFIEKDLNRPKWRDDPRMLDKVLHHKIIHLATAEDFGEVWHDLMSNPIDGVTLKSVINSLWSNPRLQNRTYLMLATYLKLKDRLDFVPAEVYGTLFGAICEESLDTVAVSKLARSLIHVEALQKLNLPVEFNEYLDATGETKKESPKIPEHYRMMKRLSKHNLTDLEARVLYCQQEMRCPMPWDSLSETESSEWESTKAELDADAKFWENSTTKANKIGLVVAESPVPGEVIHNYRRVNSINMGISRDIVLIQKLQKGFEKQTEDEMAKRNIYSRQS